MTRTAAPALIALLLAAAAPALACPPPPPPPTQQPGETAAAFRQRLATLAARDDASRLAAEQRLWDRSATVLLARVEQVQLTGNRLGTRMSRATLAPVATLKGVGVNRRFSLADTGFTDCGPIGAGEVTGGKPGELFAIYLGAGQPGRRALIDSRAVAYMRDPRVRTAADRAR